MGLGKAPVGAPPGGSTPGNTRKPASADKTAPRTKKPTASDRQASVPSSKEAQIRALREHGAGPGFPAASRARQASATGETLAQLPVLWKGRAGVFRRDIGDGEHAEVVIDWRIYRVRLSELA
jgi:hypothetical protein